MSWAGFVDFVTTPYSKEDDQPEDETIFYYEGSGIEPGTGVKALALTKLAGCVAGAVLFWPAIMKMFSQNIYLWMAITLACFGVSWIASHYLERRKKEDANRNFDISRTE